MIDRYRKREREGGLFSKAPKERERERVRERERESIALLYTLFYTLPLWQAPNLF